jgi:flagellar hook-associated protein 3 FlgL
MRISTSQIFDSGALGIQNNQSGLYKLQNQLSTGRRVLTPQDDPVAAAQALVVTQTKDVNQQYIENQGQAKSQLGLVDSQLSSLVNVLQEVRERVIQAGNTGSLSQSDRATIATELESRLSEIIGIANSDNGVGEYLFSGYKGNVRPFAIEGSLAPVPPAASRPVTYYGDDGERLLQVSSSQQMAVSVAGSDAFMVVKSGNGTFATGTGGNLATDLSPLGFTPPSVGNNQGSATVDAGSVLDQGKWNTVGNPGRFMVRFTVAVAGATTYQLYDNTTPATPVPLLAAPQPYSPGQAIKLERTSAPAADYGGQIVVQGQPKDGDSLTVAPSTSQSLFQTMQNLIGILRSPIGSSTYTATQFSNELGAELTNLDQSFNNIGTVQAQVGTRLQEIDSLGSASSDLDIQYQATLSDLQDLDYAKAISDFMNQKMNLEAAQQSFAKISGLSLFNYL